MIEHLDRAVRPNVFDVSAEPELAFAILLANLMSPRLWELAETIGHLSADDKMAALHDYVNGHFQHVVPQDIAESWGTFTLDAERERVGPDVVDRALDIVRRSQEKRRQLGLLPERLDISDLLSKGRFPAYFYATIDEAAACRRLLGRHKHKPLGLTNCLDEAVIIAAVLCLFGAKIPKNLCFLGSAYHYSTFVAEEADSVWFNGKKDYFSQAAWMRHAGAETGDGGQSYFDSFLFLADRVITASGCFYLTDRISSIPQSELDVVAAGIVGFFGADLRQMAGLQHLGDVSYRLKPSPISPAAAFAPESATATQGRVCELAAAHPGSIASAALYCFREFSLLDPRPYLEAGRRSLDSHDPVPRVPSLDAALATVASVTGSQSIFENRNRIAMPDEVLHYKPGTDRDKALLLYALLAEMTGDAAPPSESLSILFTETASYVSGPAFLIDAETQVRVEKPSGSVVAQWGPIAI